MDPTRWRRYLTDFHTDRPGITEQVLGRARGGDAYGWLADAVPAAARVLDVACGSAPLPARLPGRSYLGIDVSAAELATARARSAVPLARGEAAALPVADASVDVVVCSMGLQVLDPLPAVLAEFHRVLRPGGRLVATVPGRGPLRPRDLPVVAALLAALGRGLGYPNDEPLRRLPAALGVAGLRTADDRRRRFGMRLRTAADADLFLSSLYLPSMPAARYRAARTVLRTLARVHAEAPIPVRRVVAIRPP